MNKIELYDILTLSDDKEYTVLRMIELDDKKYYLISEIDEEENPLLNNLKIVENNSNKILKEITEDPLITKLAELFISSLDKD